MVGTASAPTPGNQGSAGGIQGLTDLVTAVKNGVEATNNLTAQLQTVLDALNTLTTTQNTTLASIETTLTSIQTTLAAVFPQATGTATTATAGSATLPAAPVGFIQVYVPSLAATVKIPYYAT